MYDVTDRNSFESISSWMEQISQVVCSDSLSRIAR